MDKRIGLERFKHEEEFPYFALLAFNEQVMNMNMGRVFTQDEAEEYFSNIIRYNSANHNAGTYKAFLQGTTTFIGICSLWIKENCAEVEYMVLPEYWNHGYASEMVACLIDKAKHMDSIKEISGLVDPENIASKTVLIKSGFKFERFMDVEENNSTIEVFTKKII